jgi:hypothetical protein
MWQMKSLGLWTHKFAARSLLLAGTTTLLSSLALVPTVNADVIISVNPPVCSYGYYGYAPYGCAPVGYYGPGYFYNGIFLGVGPWASWGYGHGWGSHRFSGGGGGRYVSARGYYGGRGYAGRGYAANRGRGSYASRSSGYRGGGHAGAARSGSSRGGSGAAAVHSGGSHGGGGGHRGR